MNEIIKWITGREVTGAADWRLAFTADYGNYVNLLLIAVFLGLAGLVLYSYIREGHSPDAAKAVLAAVRILVIVLVMLLLLRPAVVLRSTRTIFSSVLVLVDDSRSMSFKDRYADANSRQQIAGFLGVADGELEQWSRMDIVREALRRPDGVLGHLAEDHPLMLMRFSTDKPGQEAYTRSLGRVGEPPGAKPASPSTRPTSAPADVVRALEKLSARGHETNIPAALRDAIEAVQGRRVAGVVVVSDGQMTTQDARGRLADALAYARQRGVRLFPVLVGDPTPPKNLAVTGLQAPREVRRGAHTEFTVVLAHRNLSGQPVTVKLFRRQRDNDSWADTGISKTVVLDGGPASRPAAPRAAAAATKGLQTVQLSVEPTEIGQFVYRAVVEPRADEENIRDNAAEAAVEVSDEKIKILLVSGDAGWEFRYLRNFLLRQPELYRVSVWQQNADKEVSQPGSEGMKLSRLPATLPELIGSPGGKPHVGYDVVILYDPQPTEKGFDEPFIKNLQAFVQLHHGGLCYIVGNKYSDPVLRSRGPYEPLAAMVPVSLAANAGDIVSRIGQRRPEPWPVRITSYGADHPVTRLGGTADESQRVWNILPGIYWSHPVVRAKPLARTLAVSSNPFHRTGKDEPQPILVAQPYGTGRVLYVGFDGTWRWRFVRDGFYHRLFWSNVVRYLATLRARHVVITAGGDRFSAGERITIEAEAYDEKFSPLVAKTFNVEMVDTKTGRTETIVLKAVTGKPGRFKATIKAARTGTFELTALKGDPMAKEKVQSKVLRIELPKAEAARSEADRATMANIASRRENFLEIHQIDQLARLIPADRKTAVREQSVEIFGWSYKIVLPPWQWLPGWARELEFNVLLWLLVALLVTEWILRKKYNMA